VADYATRSKRFYRRYGFRYLGQSERRLFIPMATIARLPPGWIPGPTSPRLDLKAGGW